MRGTPPAAWDKARAGEPGITLRLPDSASRFTRWRGQRRSRWRMDGHYLPSSQGRWFLRSPGRPLPEPDGYGRYGHRLKAAAGIVNDRGIVALSHAGKSGQGCTDVKAGARDEHFLAPGSREGFVDSWVLPGVNNPALDDLGSCIQLRQVVQLGSGNRVGRHNRWHSQQFGSAGEAEQVVPGLLWLQDSAEQSLLLIDEQQHGVVRHDGIKRGLLGFRRHRSLPLFILLPVDR